MANGQQIGQQNAYKFEEWVATKTDDDFKQMIHRGQLNRGTIATEADIGKSALRQNDTIRQALEELEKVLRERRVLPPLSQKAMEDSEKPREYDKTLNKKVIESNHTSTLEAENVELKAKIRELEIKLERFGELSETLSEMGFMPR